MLKKMMVLALWLLCAHLPLAVAETAKGPSIYFPESEFNFGSTMEGTHVKHVFALENHGSEELRISKVRPG